MTRSPSSSTDLHPPGFFKPSLYILEVITKRKRLLSREDLQALSGSDRALLLRECRPEIDVSGGLLGSRWLRPGMEGGCRRARLPCGVVRRVGAWSWCCTGACEDAAGPLVEGELGCLLCEPR
jgi:hypothetical protein